jgi:3-hydroxy acid dehydrogenase/malonic semialdehyde reductase
MKKKTAVITGASAGIGAAAARRFAKEGYRVVLLARRREKLEEMRQELGKENAVVYELDVTSKTSVEETINRIENEVGPIDVLVNNAGAAFGLEKAFEANLHEWEKCVDVNIKGLLYCTRAVISGMVERDSGHIINLGSIAGTYPYPGGNVYGASKAFTHQFSLNLRADLLGTAVRVSCIEPGLVGGTEFSQTRFRGDVEKAKKVYENTQALTPEDIAEAIFFCAGAPPHVNINTVEMMPVSQASAPLSVFREKVSK